MFTGCTHFRSMRQTGMNKCTTALATHSQIKQMTMNDLPGQRRVPTMKDVAAEAGVSFKTVSRVMNGVPTVDAGLVVRVHEAVARLGFVPNLAASGLRRADKRSHQIGAVLVAEPLSTFLRSLLEPMQDVVMSHGSMLLAPTVTEDSGLEEYFLQSFVARRVDGIILAPASEDQAFLSQTVGRVPIVCVDRPAAGVDTDVVMATNSAGAFEAVHGFIARGHRKIAYIGDAPTFVNTAERFNGYVDALKDAEISLEPHWVRQGIRNSARAERATHEIFTSDDPPTAVFTSAAHITIGMLRALRDLGLRSVVAHIGFNDIPLADLVEPGVTIVALDSETMGRKTAELLFDRIENFGAPTRRVDVATSLVARGSGEIPPRS
jgi:LacI family transcriptional regulator